MTLSGSDRLKDVLRRISNTNAANSAAPAEVRKTGPLPAVPDCLLPGAPSDIRTSHGLQLANLDNRLATLEKQLTNQNRLLIIGLIAIVGDLVKQVLIK